MTEGGKVQNEDEVLIRTKRSNSFAKIYKKISTGKLKGRPSHTQVLGISRQRHSAPSLTFSPDALAKERGDSGDLPNTMSLFNAIKIARNRSSKTLLLTNTPLARSTSDKGCIRRASQILRQSWHLHEYRDACSNHRCPE